MRSKRNAPGALEDAETYVRRSMATTRPGNQSLFDLRTEERSHLKAWAEAKSCLHITDPTLNFEKRSKHGEHTVAFDPEEQIWWKTTHPGKAGIGAEFTYGSLPPFAISGVVARELLPSEYLRRMILHNREFGDDIRFEGFLDHPNPSLVISQPDVHGQPANYEQMTRSMCNLGYQPIGHLRIGKQNSISFYHPERRIALFDAHPGNFFQHEELAIPIDGLPYQVTLDQEHEWLIGKISL